LTGRQQSQTRFTGVVDHIGPLDGPSDGILRGPAYEVLVALVIPAGKRLHYPEDLGRAAFGEKFVGCHIGVL
jgi:hypothetical protein